MRDRVAHVGRDDDAHGLRHDDASHDLAVAHAHRVRRLELATMDGLQPGADDLGVVGGGAGGHRDDGSGERVQRDAEGGRRVVDEEEVQEQRRAAHDPDVDEGGPAQPRARRHARQGHEERGDGAEHLAQHEERDGHERGLEQDRQEPPGHREVQVHVRAPGRSVAR